MEKINKKLGFALAIMSILSCVANYSNILATPTFVVSFILGILAMTLAMIEAYHYQEYYNQNTSWFWLLYSVAFGIILTANFYVTNVGLINEQIRSSVRIGLYPMILPLIGIFFGDTGRILFKGEPSVI